MAEAVLLPPYAEHINLESILGCMLLQDDPRRQNIDDMILTLQQILPTPDPEASIVEIPKMTSLRRCTEVSLLEFFSPVSCDAG